MGARGEREGQHGDDEPVEEDVGEDGEADGGYDEGGGGAGGEEEGGRGGGGGLGAGEEALEAVHCLSCKGGKRAALSKFHDVRV